MTTLTPGTFDALVGGKTEKLWGARAIARALGVSVDKVRLLASQPDCPIYRPHGYFAYRNELENWLRTKR